MFGVVGTDTREDVLVLPVRDAWPDSRDPSHFRSWDDALSIFALTSLALLSSSSRSIVTGTQLMGYSLAFAGVCYYNYQKIVGMRLAASASTKAPEKALLLAQDSEKSAKDSA